MVTLTLRAPVQSWRNSVFVTSLVSCLCVAVPLPTYPSHSVSACQLLIHALIPIICSDFPQLKWPPAGATGLAFLTEG